MVGGNPKHDAYGFRYWKNPGAFAEHLSTGTLGRFEGFLSCIWSASFTIVGPEYVAMIATEAQRPRIYVKAAFESIYWRFGLFFILSSLCTGIVVASNDPTLVAIVTGTSEGGGTAAASPYVIAMQRLGIKGLPSFVNALLVTSIFSAGNTYTYCATRSLYGLAIDGHAPKFLRQCTKSGVPWRCTIVVMFFPFLSFLQLSSGSSQVLTWLINLVTASGVIDFIVITITYICFYNACVAQGIDRKNFPYYGWGQPYCAYIGCAWMTVIVFTYGYSSFTPWSTASFFSSYTMVIVAPLLYVSWKLIKKTKTVKSKDADLVWERPVFDAYEAAFLTQPEGFWDEMLKMIAIGRKNKGCQDSGA